MPNLQAAPHNPDLITGKTLSRLVNDINDAPIHYMEGDRLRNDVLKRLGELVQASLEHQKDGCAIPLLFQKLSFFKPDPVKPASVQTPEKALDSEASFWNIPEFEDNEQAYRAGYYYGREYLKFMQDYGNTESYKWFRALHDYSLLDHIYSYSGLENKGKYSGDVMRGFLNKVEKGINDIDEDWTGTLPYIHGALWEYMTEAQGIVGACIGLLSDHESDKTPEDDNCRYALYGAYHLLADLKEKLDKVTSKEACIIYQQESRASDAKVSQSIIDSFRGRD